MKVSKKQNNVNYTANMVSIQAATTPGTTFYSITLDDAIASLKKLKCNLFIIYELERRGWDAINIEDLYGSNIINKVLYVCVTDGQDIEIEGEMIDPEEALELYDVKDLSSYIQKADAKFISKHVTEYELNIPSGDNLNSCVSKMLRAKEDFDTICKDYQEIKAI